MEGKLKLRDVIVFGEEGEMTVVVPALAGYTRQMLGLIPVHSARDGAMLYRYERGCYYPCTHEFVLGFMKETIERSDMNLVKMKQLREALDLIFASTAYYPLEEINQNEGILNFQNGALSFSERPPILLSHSPEIRTSIQLPCQWQAEPEPTPVFDRYLQAITGGDQEMELFLLQWIGLCLSNIPGWRSRRVLFTVGDGDAGAQLLRLTQRLLGRDHCAGLDLEGLETIPGSRILFGKRLVGSSSMGSNRIYELKQFQRVVAGDLLDLGRGASFTYEGLLWFCCREFPDIKHKSDHQAIGQIILFPCCETPVEDILENLYQERNGIVSKAVHALVDVIDNGYEISEPRRVFAARERLLGHSNSVIHFFLECMEPRVDGKITKGEATTGRVYRVYLEWCHDIGETPEVNWKRFREILSRYLRCRHKDLVRRQKGNSYYGGYTLTSEARSRFLGKVS